MDLFTEKANEIIKSLDTFKPLSEEKVVYSSEEEELKAAKKTDDSTEEDAESPEDKALKAMGLDPKAVAAVSFAQKMSTQAAKSGVPGFRTDPQKAMNQAYGKLMTNIANKISNLSKGIS